MKKKIEQDNRAAEKMSKNRKNVMFKQARHIGINFL